MPKPSKTTTLKCDFCAAHNPTWVYTIKHLRIAQIATTLFLDDGGWAACNACYTLIEAKELWKLSIRAASSNNTDNQEVIGALYNLYTDLLSNTNNPVRLQD